MTPGPGFRAWSFRPGFSRGPYAMSHVVQHGLDALLIALDDGGSTALAEVVHAPPLDNDQRARINARCLELLDALSRLPRAALDDSLLDHAARLRPEGYAGCGIAFALETLAVQREAFRQGEAMADLMGRHARSAPGYLSISEPTLAATLDRLDHDGGHHAVIQLKIGMASVEDDAATVSAVLDRLGAHQQLLADANGARGVDAAIALAGRIHDPRLVWEEPCATTEENTALVERTGARVMFDQCVSERRAALETIAQGRAHAVCIKPAFLGGLTVARELVEAAVRAGMPMRIDGPWCGDVAASVVVHLALTAPPELLVASADLREPLALSPCLGGVTAPEPGRVAPPAGTGLPMAHGVEALGPPDWSFRASGD